MQAGHPKLKVLSRATLVIEQNATLHQLNQVASNGYDIVAVRPKN
jgi:RNase P/RNase MRP subunit p30